MRAAIVLAAGVVAVNVLAPSRAEACSIMQPPTQQPCVTLRLYAPAPQFPLALHASVHLGLDYVDELGAHRTPDNDDFNVDPSPVVERLGDEGYVPVAFSLEDEDNLVPGVRRLVLADPRPGDYRVAWAGSTCAVTEVDTGAGKLIGTFTLLEDTPFPEDIGALSSRFEVVDQEFHLGEDSMCNDVTTRARVGVATFTLTWSEEALPWAEALDVAVYLNGELEHGFSKASVSPDGTYSRQVRALCSADDPEAVQNMSFGPSSGTHTVELVARADGFEEVSTAPVTYTVECPDVDDDDADVLEMFGGCAATDGADRGALVALLLAGLLGGLSRRRRRCPRATPP